MLDKESDAAVKRVLEDWRKSGKIRQFWRGDASLWTGTDEAKWLGWLSAPSDSTAQIQEIGALASDLRKEGITSAVLLGMGGSSLGAEVFARVFGPQAGWPVLHILDSTDPAAIRDVEASVNLTRTVFIVSSKSGTTLEPNILMDYFMHRLAAANVADPARHFVAITDPGSDLVRAADAHGFRKVFLGNPEIGGRYSVLSVFGLAPAAIAGVNVAKLLQSTAKMVNSCGRHVPPEQNPGVQLGAALGTLARAGRDKVTIITSPTIASFGAWLEQLIAESTGKEGKGLIPVDAEPLAAPDVYGRDRIFVYLRLDQAFDSNQESAVAALEKSGHPVLRIAIADDYDIGQEFFRWEIATAVAGSVIGINPFNQPDVEASKVKTRALMNAPAGSMKSEAPVFRSNGFSVFAGQKSTSAQSGANSLSGLLSQFFAGAQPGDYCAILAYLNATQNVTKSVQEIRRAVLDRKHIATCAGIGPRFLHSTGQAYKGGPNTGLFLQITSDHEPDLEVPEHPYTFGQVIDATARGDFEVLIERGRRALRVHLGQDTETGLRKLEQAISEALG
jgi:transaldolase/glucose-6-phosphate isomerase